MKVDDTVERILGTLYIDKAGDIILLNDTGAHTILIEDHNAGMPSKVSSMLYVRSCRVDWEPGITEFWAEDIWEDLMEDSAEEHGIEYTEQLKLRVKDNFKSLILTTNT